MYKFFLLLLLVVQSHLAYCQNLTGTWEGSLDVYQFLQVNIVQTSKGICGYTYDYELGKKEESYCRQYFTATWNEKEKKLKIKGSKIFETTGMHSLMILNLSYNKNNDGDFFKGTSSAKSAVLKLLTLGNKQEVFLKKVSNTPSQYRNDLYKPCMNDTTVIDTTKTIVVKKDSIKYTPPVVKDTSNSINSLLVARKNEIVSTIKTKATKLVINVYDNATIDGDTVSVFYNGKLLVTNLPLSDKPYTITINLNKESAIHDIVLVAQNLGSIPPNTALLIIEAAGKRYELNAAADLSKNARIIFEYNEAAD